MCVVGFVVVVVVCLFVCLFVCLLSNLYFLCQILYFNVDVVVAVGRATDGTVLRQL